MAALIRQFALAVGHAGLRMRSDPTAALLRRCAEGTADPYVEQLRAEQDGANRRAAAGVRGATGTASAANLPNLTPRR